MFGRINLSSTYLQPVGSPLGSASVSPAEAKGLSPETLLWECDKSDADSLYEMFATNGDDRVGGYWEIGNGQGATVNDGLPGYFATWFPYVAIKITHVNSGKVLSRFWQEAKLTQYDTDGNKIQIRAKHLSMLHGELARVSSTAPPRGARSHFCSLGPGRGEIVTYKCGQPSAYVALKGPGLVTDDLGSDSSVAYDFFWAHNGIAFGISHTTSLSKKASCAVRNVTPVVNFMPITVSQLNQGMTRSSDFSIETECSDDAISGTDGSQVALGIKVLSANAHAQAKALGLLTGLGGVRYLLSDGYGSSPAVATGVGISLRNAGSGEQMNFLGSEVTGGGAQAGWYPVLSGASNNGSRESGHRTYIHTITATLSTLPGQTPKPGIVDAKASVLVKLQ